jgi:hypothetical protein
MFTKIKLMPIILTLAIIALMFCLGAVIVYSFEPSIRITEVDSLHLVVSSYGDIRFDKATLGSEDQEMTIEDGYARIALGLLKKGEHKLLFKGISEGKLYDGESKIPIRKLSIFEKTNRWLLKIHRRMNKEDECQEMIYSDSSYFKNKWNDTELGLFTIRFWL